MPLSRIPTLVTQCRQHMGLNVVPCNGVHEARLRDDGMRIRRHSHEPRGYGTESVDIHPSLLEGMDTHRGTCRWKPGSSAAHSVAATTRVRSSDP